MREKDRNAMEALARARPAALDPTRLAGSPRQHTELVELMSAQSAQGTRSARRRGLGRPRMLVPLVGIAAAAAVAISAVAVGVIQDRGTTQVSAAGPDGHLVLLSMAQSVQNQAMSGAYWQIETQNRYLTVIPGEGSANSSTNGLPYVISDISQSNWSIGVRPGEQSQQVSGINETRGPWMSQDTQRWVLAGSPMTVEADGGKKDNLDMRLQEPVGSGKPEVNRTDWEGKILSLGPDNVSYPDLQQLPSDQNQLASFLTKLYQQDGGESNTDQPDWMFTQIGGLITFPVSSAVRASAYRILAGLPGITSLGSVTDPLGRGGVGVALPAKQYNDLGEQQQQLIVDPTTSTILSQQTVLVHPSDLALAAGMKAGTVTYYTATTHIGWTDRQAEVPTTR